jgi:hypothetical protein
VPRLRACGHTVASRIGRKVAAQGHSLKYLARSKQSSISFSGQLVYLISLCVPRMHISLLRPIPFNEPSQKLGPATRPTSSSFTLTQIYLCTHMNAPIDMISSTQEIAKACRETVRLYKKMLKLDDGHAGQQKSYSSSLHRSTSGDGSYLGPHAVMFPSSLTVLALSLPPS